MKKRKRKLPVAMCEQLIRLHHEITCGPLKRHVARARIRAVLRWGGSEWPGLNPSSILKGAMTFETRTLVDLETLKEADRRK